MTPRMIAAIENPHLDILGHCTGRLITGRRGRPQSEFDAEAVFAACARYDKAVEINCRPERLDPPPDLLRLAVEAGCKFAVNTDAHTPEELQWQLLGCRMAAEAGLSVEAVVNTWQPDDLIAWARRHDVGRQGAGTWPAP
jgi:putative hydrolase